MLAMAWDLLLGPTGEVHLGPAFLTGLGGYVAGLLNAQGGGPAALPAGGRCG